MIRRLGVNVTLTYGAYFSWWPKIIKHRSGVLGLRTVLDVQWIGRCWSVSWYSWVL